MTAIPTMGPYQCATARLKLARAVASVKPTSRLAQAGGLVRTSYLTTLTGAEKHIFSVALHQGVEALLTHPANVTVDYLGSLAKSLASKAKGENLPPSAFRTTAWALDRQGARLAWRAFAKGSVEAWRAIRARVDPEVVGDAFNVGRTTYGNPMLQGAVDAVNTFVTARNKPFWEMGLQGSLYVQAKTLALREGLTGEAATARVNQLLAKPTDEMAANALEFASRQTFSNVGPMTRGVEGLRRSLSTLRDAEPTRGPKERAKIQATVEGLSGDRAHERVNRLLSLSPAEFEQQAKVPRTMTGATAAARRAEGAAAGVGLLGLDVAYPFARIGFNLAGRAVDYSPLGAAKALIWSAAAKDPAILKSGLIKAGVGSAFGYAMGYYLASHGLMTGGANRAHPNQIRIGDAWHDYTVFMPFGIMPLLGANFYEQQQAHPESLVRNLGVAIGEQAKTLSEESVLYSMQHLSDAMQPNAQKVAQGVSAFLPIPPLAGQIARGIDPTVRDTRSDNVLHAILNQQMSRLPLASYLLPPRYDRSGMPLQRPEGIAGALFDPTRPMSLQVPARPPVKRR